MIKSHAFWAEYSIDNYEIFPLHTVIIGQYMRFGVGLRILCRRVGFGGRSGLENQTHAGLWPLDTFNTLQVA